MADLLDVLAKIKLDTSDYKKGLSEASSASSQTASSISSAFSNMGKAISVVNDFVDGFAEGFAEGAAEASQGANKAGNSIDTLKNKIGAMEAKVESSRSKVDELTEEFNKTAKEEGMASEKTQELAKELDEAEKEMKDNEKELEGLQNELKGYSKEADGASEKASGTGEKIAHAFGVVGKAGVEALTKAVKITAAAIGGAAAGIGAIVKQSVDAFGEWEQLAGGAQKIFDEMDFSVIKNDAKNAYKELNMSMNDYIEAINLAGATFSTTMGDKEAYDTARKGMLAISDFATGTGKDINELTQKYQMITRAASSYQSIADQFAGILPQTANDFLAQAQAAGLLSEEYTKLTEVPVAEYQQAVTEMLSKGVADLGLANNALKESEGTLTGSMAMTKAAWENLVMSLANGEEDITEYIDKFVESASASLDNILPIVEQALSGVGDLIDEMLPKIVDRIPAMIEDGGILSKLLESGKKVVESIANGINENIDTVTGFAEQIIMTLGSALGTVLPTLLKVGGVIVSTLGNAIISHLDEILDAAGQILEMVLTGISDNAESLVDAAVMIIESLAGFISENADLIISSCVDIAMALIRGVTENAGLFIDLAMQILVALTSAILDNIDVIIQTVPLIINGFIDGLVSHLPDMVAAWVKLMDTLELALPEIVDSILAVLPQLMDTIVNYYLGDGAKQTLQAGLVMFGALNKALNNIVIDIIARIGMFIRNIGSQIAGEAKTLLESGKTFFGGLLTGITGKISEIITKVTSFVSNIGSTISEGFMSILNKARTWGLDLIQNFLDGIKQKWNDLKSTVTGIADMFNKNVGHSHPTEGPMADDYKWMPDMMDLFIKGINDNKRKLQNTVTDAFDFKDDIASPEMSITATAKASDTSDSDIERLLDKMNLTLYNVTEIDGEVIKKQSYKYTLNQLGADTRAMKVAMGGYV